MTRNSKDSSLLAHENNSIVKEQCYNLKRQNIEHTKALKKQKTCNLITCGITTAIDFASVVENFF